MAGLLRAIYRASLWCEQPDHHWELAMLLSQPRYVDAPAEMLMRGLANQLSLLPGEPPRPLHDFYVLARQFATFPWTSHALWFYSQMVRWRQIEFQPEHIAMVRAVYRPDLYRAALQQLQIDMPASDTKVEGPHAPGARGGADLVAGLGGFFDGRQFDPDELAAYGAGPRARGRRQ
jgi:NitT/TauT family transport system ATP-binding protein